MRKNTRKSGAKTAPARQAAGIDVLAELAALKAMTVPELQAKWQAVFGERAPNASRGNLELRLGYRIQELAHGGLRRETRRTLDALAEEVSVARARCDEADRTVQVRAVIPADEGLHPRLRISLRGEPLGRPAGSVFAGPEQRLGERVVVADARAAVGRGDAQFFHRDLHRGPLHGAAVVGVQDQRAQGAAFRQNRLPDQGGRQLRAFALMNFPADDLPGTSIFDRFRDRSASHTA